MRCREFLYKTYGTIFPQCWAMSGAAIQRRSPYGCSNASSPYHRILAMWCWTRFVGALRPVSPRNASTASGSASTSQRRAAELVNLRVHQDLGLLTWRAIHRTDIPQRTDIGALPAPNCRANREYLYGRQSGECAGCRTLFAAQHLEVDHIIARAKGGTDHLDNLQLLCGHCNRVKGDRGREYLRTKLQLVA